LPPSNPTFNHPNRLSDTGHSFIHFEQAHFSALLRSFCGDADVTSIQVTLKRNDLGAFRVVDDRSRLSAKSAEHDFGICARSGKPRQRGVRVGYPTTGSFSSRPELSRFVACRRKMKSSSR
jgi:hypothetical protein